MELSHCGCSDFSMGSESLYTMSNSICILMYIIMWHLDLDYIGIIFAKLKLYCIVVEFSQCGCWKNSTGSESVYVSPTYHLNLVCVGSFLRKSSKTTCLQTYSFSINTIKLPHNLCRKQIEKLSSRKKISSTKRDPHLGRKKSKTTKSVASATQKSRSQS